MIKVVLDTTVLLPPCSGLSQRELLKLAAEGRYEFFLSDDILEETAATLVASERNRRRYKYSDENIVAYCEELARIGTVIFDIPNLIGIVRDPNDDMILACAVAATAPVSLERLHLCREGSREFIESPLRAVLLRDVFHMCEAARESHCRHVNGGHLRREHRLHLVIRFDALHNGEHEIEPVLVRRAALRSGIEELLEEPVQEVEVPCTSGVGS
jgi:predicted nucleic acid-binding protein